MMKIHPWWIFASVIIAVSAAIIVLLIVGNNENHMTFAPSYTSDQVVTPEETANYSSSFLTMHITGIFRGFDQASVPVGTMVVWQNDDSVDHYVASDTGAFDSGSIAPDSSFTYVFADAGNYPYHYDNSSNVNCEITVQ